MAHTYGYYRARRRLLVVLALAAVVLFHAALCARLFLSPEQVRFRVQTLLAAHSPGKATVGAAAYELPFGVRLGDIELYRGEEDGGGLFFRAKALRVRARPLMLLRGKLALDHLVFEGPELRVLPPTREARGPAREPPDVPVDRIIWRGGTLHFEAGALYEKSPPQTLRAVNLESTKVLRLANAFDFEGSAESDLWGRCDLEGVANLLRRRLDATVVARDVPIDDKLLELLGESPRTGMLARNLERYGIKGTVDLRVEASVERAQADDGSAGPLHTAIKATVALADCEAMWERLPLRLTGLRGQVVYDGHNTYYRNIQGRAGTADVALSGRSANVDRPGEIKVDMDLTVRDRRLDGALYEAVSQYLHPRLERRVLKEVWDRCGIEGGVFDLDYHSTWWQEDRSHQGKALARVRDAQATYRHFPYPLEKIAGTVRWEQGRGQPGGVTYIDKLTGQRGKASAELTGSATNAGVVDVTIRAFDIPCDDVLRNALHPNARKTYDALQPRGRLAAEVQVKGPTKPPAKPVYRYTIRPEGISFQHRDSPYRIDDVRGAIEIDETGSIRLRDLDGKLGHVPVRLLGSITAEGEGEQRKQLLDITVVAEEVELDPRARALIHQEASRRVYDELEPQGKVRVAWRLTTDPATGKGRQRMEIRALQGCSIRHKRFPVRIQGLMGSIVIEDRGRTTFTGMRGRIDRASLEALEGAYDPDSNELRFKLRGRGLAFSKAIHDALPEQWGKVWDQLSPDGEANVEYHFRSNPDDKAKPFQRVLVEPAGASVCPRQFPLKITDLSRGVVDVDQDGVTKIGNVQGKYRGRTITLSGQSTASPTGAVLTLDVSAAELALDEDLRRALATDWQQAFAQLKLGGTLGADAHIRLSLATGKIEDFALEAHLKGCEATWARLPVRATELRGTVSYAGGVATLTDVVGRTGVADEVRLDGQVAEAAAQKPTRLRVRARQVSLTPELRAALPPAVREALAALAFQGSVALLDLTVTRDGTAKEPTHCFGSVTVRDGSFKRRWAFEKVSGDVRIDRGEIRADGSTAFVGSLRLDRLVAQKLPFTAMRGQFAYSQPKQDAAGQLELSSLVGSICGGRVTAEARLGFAKDAPFSGVFRVSGADFKDVLAEVAKSGYRATGLLDLRLEFPPGAEKAEKGLVGDGWATVTRGDLGNLPVVVALFSLLRFAAPDRTLTHAEMKFGIAEDHVRIKELLLGRDEGLLTHGYGTVGYDGKLELNFITSKRGLIPSLVGPLLDTLVRYEVRGTLSDPKPNPRPLPITKSIIDEFKRGFGIWRAIMGSRDEPEKPPEPPRQP